METTEDHLEMSQQVLSELADLATRCGWKGIEREAAGLAAKMNAAPESVLLVGPEALSAEDRETLAKRNVPVRIVDIDDDAKGDDGAPAGRIAEGCRVGLVWRAGRLISPEVFKLVCSLRQSRPPGLLLLAFAGAQELDEADRELAELAARRLLEPDQPFSGPSRPSEGLRFPTSCGELADWFSAPSDGPDVAAMRRLQVGSLIAEAELAAGEIPAAPEPETVPVVDTSVVLRRLKDETRLLRRQIATTLNTLQLDLPAQAGLGADPVRARLQAWRTEVQDLAVRWREKCLAELRAAGLIPAERPLVLDFQLMPDQECLVGIPAVDLSSGEQNPKDSPEGLWSHAATGAALGSGAVLSGAILLSRLIPLPTLLTATAAASGGLLGGALATSIETRRRQHQMAVKNRARQAASATQAAQAEIERRLAAAEATLVSVIRRHSQIAEPPASKQPQALPEAAESQPLTEQLGRLRNRLFGTKCST